MCHTHDSGEYRQGMPCLYNHNQNRNQNHNRTELLGHLSYFKNFQLTGIRSRDMIIMKKSDIYQKQFN